jgi:hypothetical protein
MENYDTLTEAIDALKTQGYTEDFNIHDNLLRSASGKHTLGHSEFVIDKSFRFDVDEDPSDQAMLYAISSVDNNIKGILVNGYGIYSEDGTNELLEKLQKVHKR